MRGSLKINDSISEQCMCQVKLIKERKKRKKEFFKQVGLASICTIIVSIFMLTGSHFITEHNMSPHNIMLALLALLLMLFIIYVRQMYFEMKYKEKMYNLAYADSMTGLGTMARFNDDLKELVKKLKNNKDEENEYMIASFDINKLKNINETMGFNYGTRIITSVALQLQKRLLPDECCYRSANDNFYMILRKTTKEKDIERLKGILADMTAFYQDNYGHLITFACGIYRMDCDLAENEDISSLYNKADIARKNSKGKTTNVVEIFNEKTIQQLKEEREIEDAFIPAIQNGEFIMYYQPKYFVSKDGEPVLGGAEALVRWISPTKGFMPPGKFIPLFEKDGNAVILDMHILELVCEQLHRWLEEGYNLVPVSVNVCRQTLMKGLEFINEAEALLADYNIPRELIQLEVLETATGENEELMVNFLNMMHAKGFKIAMDDFGRGHSSLGMIQKMPLDYLKLDKSFFDKWTEEPENKVREASLVKRTIQLGKDMDMVIVAEGIEEEFQVERLQEFGCDMIQGYYFSKPLPAKEFEEKLNKLVV